MLYNDPLSQPKGRKLGIFLFFLFLFVSFIIFLWGYKYYRDAVDATEKDMESTNCWAYSYLVRDIVYQDNNLSFVIENKQHSDGRIKHVTVVTQNEIKEIETPTIAQGMSRKIIIENIDIKEKFYVYIENCKDLIKEYNI
jgi:hypothetical protein